MPVQQRCLSLKLNSRADPNAPSRADPNAPNALMLRIKARCVDPVKNGDHGTFLNGLRYSENVIGGVKFMLEYFTIIVPSLGL